MADSLSSAEIELKSLRTYLVDRLLEMLAIPSPTGLTNEISRYVCQELNKLAIDYKLTRRGTIVAEVPGARSDSSRAIVNHLDTIGAVVDDLKSNGRLSIKPVGTWSSRFAEGGRVTVFAGSGQIYRGQVLPLLASGHAFNKAVDELPVGWDQIELRLNEESESSDELRSLGITRGDFIAFDPDPDFDVNGYLCARHLDNKAGAAALLGALRLLQSSSRQPTFTLKIVFTVTEEVGTGAAASLDSDVAEFVGIDIGPVAPGQNAKEKGVTLCAQDTSGPFDRHLLNHLRAICKDAGIQCQTDLFRYYYSDANSAVRAGHDVRDALITFGTDATHGYERTHVDSLTSIAALLFHYSLSPLSRSE